MLLRIDYEHELTPELGGGQTEEGGAQKDEEYDPLKPGIWESGEGTSNGRGGRSIAHGDGYVSDRADGVGSAERKRVRAEANEGQREGRVAASESPAKSPEKSAAKSAAKSPSAACWEERPLSSGLSQGGLGIRPSPPPPPPSRAGLGQGGLRPTPGRAGGVCGGCSPKLRSPKLGVSGACSGRCGCASSISCCAL